MNLLDGDVVQLVDATGGIVEDYEYEAYAYDVTIGRGLPWTSFESVQRDIFNQAQHLIFMNEI